MCAGWGDERPVSISASPAPWSFMIKLRDVEGIVKKISSIIILGVLAATALPGAAQGSGVALYKSKCQVCHGADGKGSSTGRAIGVKAFSDPDVAKQSDSELIGVIRKGKGKMPAYEGKLTDDEIKSLIKYIRSLK